MVVNEKYQQAVMPGEFPYPIKLEYDKQNMMLKATLLWLPKTTTNSQGILAGKAKITSVSSDCIFYIEYRYPRKKRRHCSYKNGKRGSKKHSVPLAGNWRCMTEPVEAKVGATCTLRIPSYLRNAEWGTSVFRRARHKFKIACSNYYRYKTNRVPTNPEQFVYKVDVRARCDPADNEQGTYVDIVSNTLSLKYTVSDYNMRSKESGGPQLLRMTFDSVK